MRFLEADINNLIHTWTCKGENEIGEDWYLFDPVLEIDSVKNCKVVAHFMIVAEYLKVHVGEVYHLLIII